MTKYFTIVANTFLALALFVSPGGSLSQTLAPKNSEDASSQDEKRLERFEKQVDDLRTLLGIPGMSAAVIKDQKLIWARGFGFADLEHRIPATPDTVFHLASLTKTFAATLIMQLLEQGKLDLDEPMSHYSSDFKNDSVKIKHLLTHTSEGTPGERYQYSGDQFEHLTAVIEKKFGKPFRVVIVETFFEPLGMSSSVPVHNIMDEADKWVASLGKENLDRYAQNLSRLSQPYTLYGREMILVPYPPKGFVGAAAGLLSTVVDMAKYDAAIDRHVFLKKETQEKAWTPFVSNSGQRLPYGFGWFVTDYHGLKLIWHFGHWGTGFSAIYLKVPEKNVSLVMLANSEALADHQFQVGEDIVNNVFACNFLRLFVSEDAHASDCERNSQRALAKWIENRQKNARKPVRLNPDILEAYVGQYQYETQPDRIVTVSREGDRLFANIPGNFRSELFAESESKFFLKIAKRQVVFVRDGKQVTHFDLIGEGWTVRAKKIK